MRKLLLSAFFLFTSIILLGQTPGEWTWMGGDNVGDAWSSLGIKGVPDSNNSPAALYEPCQWTDLNNNFWLFGGLNHSWITGYLWKYDPLTSEWTWVSGDSCSLGVYGTKGIPSINNHPGARAWGVGTWTDLDGNLWLFGGTGNDGVGCSGDLNDLWKYNILTNEWTWMAGTNIAGDSGNYGIQGVGSPTNVPRCRSECVCTWQIGDDLWLFGGVCEGNELNDLWKYSISSNEWTWMKGDSISGQDGVYGSVGIENPNYKPGARWGSYSRLSQNCEFLWLFSGYDENHLFNMEYFDDIWKYNISSNSWSWEGGTNIPNFNGVNLSLCTSSALEGPSARFENRACWVDKCGNLWNYGGISEDNGGTAGDLWHFDINTKEWTFVNGSLLLNQEAEFGQKYISNAANFPGGRYGSVSWTDQQGNFWMFGGSLYNYKLGNDLWKYVPDTNCPLITCNNPITISSNVTIDKGSSVYLTATGGASYLWNTGEITPTISVHPEATTTYTVNIILANGCVTKKTVTVFIYETTNPEQTQIFYVPNVFSPNGDGRNDIFYIRGERIKQLVLKIYNRWGNLVFESNDILNGWNGQFMNTDCPEAVYFYYFEITFVNGAIKTKKGNLTLIR